MNTISTPLKHSGLGIASTVIAVFAGLAMLAVFVYAGYIGGDAGDSATSIAVDASGIGGLLAAFQSLSKRPAPALRSE